MAYEDLDLNSKEYCELGDYMRAEAAKMLKKQELRNNSKKIK